MTYNKLGRGNDNIKIQSWPSDVTETLKSKSFKMGRVDKMKKDGLEFRATMKREGEENTIR